jgi:hypothetical protein
VSHKCYPELIAAVCFWSTFTALSVQLFYWSVWKLGRSHFNYQADIVALAGSELALVANLSAYTLSTPWVLHFVTSKRGLFWNRVAMVLGGMASWILPNPFSRLLAVSIGTWCGWLALFGNWARLKGSKEMIAEGQGESILHFLGWY